MNKRFAIRAVVLSLAATVVAPFAITSFAAEQTNVGSLAQNTHFHGIAVDASEPTRLYIATHHGLYLVERDGKARRISETRDDFMGFTAHPSDAAVLYASGHPSGGGNLGFIASSDGGRSWTRLSDGIGGPVDFHSMDVSKADPNVVYGVFGGVQRSADGGLNWTKIGPAPDGLIDLAASSKHADTLYAATKTGLVRSMDAGRTWELAHIIRRPATMIHATSRGDVYAYIIGTGLVRATDGEANWQRLSSAFDGAYLLHMAADPSDHKNLYAVAFDPQTKSQRIIASGDGGKTWRTLGAPEE